MTTLNKYRLYCNTDSTYEYIWSETEPTTCPTNTAHTIDANQTAIIERREPNTITIKEETTPTNGYYRFQGYNESIPASNPIGNVTVTDLSWEYPVSILDGWFFTSEKQKDDRVDVVIGENTIIGTITANVTTNDTDINVSSTVMDNIQIGWDVNLFDGITSEDLGRTLSKDTANSIITVETAATNNFNVASPTYVRASVKTIDCLHLNVTNVRYAFAEKKLGGRYVPKDTVVRIKYKNNEGNAKNFVFNIEYLY